MTRDPFARYLERMAAVGFRPSSVLGQNFLLDPSLHRWIAERAAPGCGDLVVEIGVGLGFLTRELADTGAQVLAVEIDGRLMQLAQEELGERPNIEWLLADALSGPGRTLAPRIGAAAVATVAQGGRVLVAANLPYAVSGPLLAELVALDALPERALLLVQKELAQRIAAPLGAAEHGGLTALVQSVYTAKSVRDVPPQVFRPRPKVMSALLELQRREQAPLAGSPGARRRSFGVFVRQLFQQRRKVLRTTLPAAAAAIGAPPPALAEAVLALRAEAIPVPELVQWFLQMQPAPEA